MPLDSNKEPYKLEYAVNLFYTALSHPNGITRPDVWLGHFSRLELNQYQRRLFKALKRDEGFRRTPFQVVFPGQIAGLIKRISDSERAEYFFSDSERAMYTSSGSDMSRTTCAKAGGVSRTQPIEKRVVLEHAQKPPCLPRAKAHCVHMAVSDISSHFLDDSFDEAHIRFYADGAVSCEIEPNRFRKEHYGKSVDGSDYLVNLIQKNASLTPDEKDCIISQIEPKEVSAICAANEENPHYVKFMKGAKIIAGLAAYAVAVRYQEIVEPLIGITFLCATLLFGSARIGIYVNDALSKRLNNRNNLPTNINTKQ